jgi:hypothetical protein
MLASEITDSASILLQDIDKTRWTDAELRQWLYDGQVEAARIPGINTVPIVFQLVAGSKQTLPANAIAALRFTRNMGSNGTTPGNAIRPVFRKEIDAFVPGWMSATGNVVEHVIYEPEVDDRTFYVYPSSTNYIEIYVSQMPTAITGPTSTVSLGDDYRNALLDYVLYRAYSKDAEHGNINNKALTHWHGFANGVGLGQPNA